MNKRISKVLTSLPGQTHPLQTGFAPTERCLEPWAWWRGPGPAQGHTSKRHSPRGLLVRTGQGPPFSMWHQKNSSAFGMNVTELKKIFCPIENILIDSLTILYGYPQN